MQKYYKQIHHLMMKFISQFLILDLSIDPNYDAW